MLPVSDMVNKTVITRDGRIVGKVAALQVDQEWKVPLLTMAVNRDVAERIDLRKPLFGTPKVFLDPAEVAALSDNVILQRSLEELPDHFVSAGRGVEADRILGRKVTGEGGYHFGSVDNLALDSGRWKITDVLVDVHRKAADEMGFPMTLFGTCRAKVPVRAVEEVEDRLRLAVGPQEFKKFVVKQRSRA